MAFKYCPECGTAIEAGARFCTGCGQAIGAGRPASAVPVTGAVALAILLLLGGGFWLYFRMAPEPVRPLKPGEGQLPTAPPAAGAAATASGQQHPQIELPDDIKQYIANLEKEGKAKPDDVATWQTLARVQYRASRLDPSYGAAALASFEHLLEIDPDNLDGMRGLGNIAYDRQDREKAIEYYERYLSLKPDDPEVRTDLGTMLFETGDAERSVAEFERVIAKNPEFFQAYFNLGIVYEAQGDREAARAQLEKARELAPDPNVKQRIGALVAAAERGIPFTEAAEAFVAQQAQAQAPGAAPAMGGAAVAGPGAAGGPGETGAPPPPDTFPASVEQVFRGNPVAGPKVTRVEWPSEARGRVVMSSFPMEAMPDPMRNSYLDKMTKGVREAKERFAVQGPVEVEIVDQATGKVMATVTP